MKFRIGSRARASKRWRRASATWPTRRKSRTRCCSGSRPGRSSTPARSISSPVADRKPFLLRIDREVLDAVQRWADDDLRSLNGQIEFLLRRALKEAGRKLKTED